MSARLLWWLLAAGAVLLVVTTAALIIAPQRPAQRVYEEGRESDIMRQIGKQMRAP